MVPSELIRVALIDLELCEKDDKYFVSMNSWHHPYKKEDICYVCLAGAVMAKSLHMNRARFGEPCDFPRQISLKLRALNWLREGRVTKGMSVYFESMGDNIIPKIMLEDVSVTPYWANPHNFKVDMHDLADALEKEGY